VRCRLTVSYVFHVHVGRTKYDDLKLQEERSRLGVWGTFKMVKERRSEVVFGKVLDSPSRWPLKWDNGASATDMKRGIDMDISWVRNWTRATLKVYLSRLINCSFLPSLQRSISEPILLCLSRIQPYKPVFCLNSSDGICLTLEQPSSYY